MCRRTARAGDHPEHARRLVLKHPYTGGKIDVTAPLPEHMQKTWELLGLDAERYE